VPNPLTELKPKVFLDTSSRKLEVLSAKVSGVKYILNIEWEEIGKNYRLVQILKR